MTVVTYRKRRRSTGIPTPPYEPPATLVEALRHELIVAIEVADLSENLGTVTRLAREGGTLVAPHLFRERRLRIPRLVGPRKGVEKPLKITYKPPPAPLVEEIRTELRRMALSEDLVEALPGLHRFASQADDLLMLLKAPEAIVDKENSVFVGAAQAGPSNAETYGATILRELFANIQAWQSREKESLESITGSIALARRTGMTDIAAKLEEKLLGKTVAPADTPRPVKLPDSVETYLNGVDGGERADMNEKETPAP